jgi:hypothetical protein
MTPDAQVVTISASAATFTIACERCARHDIAEGYTGSTFAGRLDLDLAGGTFLCRRGHTVRVERAAVSERPAATAAA